MHYTDFALRAWQANPNQVHLIVHSSPAGDLRHPTVVQVNASELDAIKARFFRRSWVYDFTQTAELVSLGQALAAMLLPMPVLSLLLRSLEQLEPEHSLRLRLCLDANLMDLPWEFLYRPDYTDADRLDGFLVLDERLSLVREAPLLPIKAVPSLAQERLVFAGTLWAGDKDRFLVHEEYARLQTSLEPLADLLSMEFITSTGANLDATLRTPASIFHYAGHANAEQGNGYLAESVLNDQEVDPIWCVKVAGYLRRAGVRLAVFNACNGAHWAVAEPFLRQGIPALIGIQGNLVNEIAIEFSAKLYQHLALGLTLDEAVHAARLHLLEVETSFGVPGWSLGTYVVYMPTHHPILFPRPDDQEIQARQQAIRQETTPIVQTVNNYFYAPQTNIEGGVDTGGGTMNTGEFAMRGSDFAPKVKA